MKTAEDFIFHPTLVLGNQKHPFKTGTCWRKKHGSAMKGIVQIGLTLYDLREEEDDQDEKVEQLHGTCSVGPSLELLQRRNQWHSVVE